MPTRAAALSFLVIFSFGLAVTARGQQRGNQPPPGPPPKLTKVTNDLYLIENQGQTTADIGPYGGNLVIYLTDEGVLLVDSKNDRIHSDVLAKIKSLTDKPVKYVVLTHNHGDHAAGAPMFASEGAQVIISMNDRENMARTANQQWLPPFAYAGQAKIFLGEKEAQLYEYRGHTRGDTVVYFPAARVLAMGDLLTSVDGIPLIINGSDGGNWTDWTKSVDDILKMDFDIVIPGHGPMIMKPQLRNIRDKFVAIQTKVRAMNRERKTPEEITEAIKQEFGYTGNMTSFIQELR
jgi:glyoxylase-like metal-dependent hydrolase (beta-lactamase superfamily II)